MAAPALRPGVTLWPGPWWFLAAITMVVLLRWAPALAQPLLVIVVLLVLLSVADQGLFSTM